ncbi:hypothetical protein llap_11772 [Limosa lapponica baueri]|uniref:Uncharacterized protein n=1 Tax=Limosa lapponica baueri TaxID=1758121 RepID=A0A2I0TVT6_LIMLA|nr:hypothetical protein llap_11772 [Limosa lapponica baueri]
MTCQLLTLLQKDKVSKDIVIIIDVLTVSEVFMPMTQKKIGKSFLSNVNLFKKEKKGKKKPTKHPKSKKNPKSKKKEKKKPPNIQKAKNTLQHFYLIRGWLMIYSSEKLPTLPLGTQNLNKKKGFTNV